MLGDLKTIIDSLLLPYEFDAQEMSAKGVTAIEITEETVDKGTDPKLIFKNDGSTKTKEQKAQ